VTDCFLPQTMPLALVSVLHRTFSLDYVLPLGGQRARPRPEPSAFPAFSSGKDRDSSSASPSRGAASPRGAGCPAFLDVERNGKWHQKPSVLLSSGGTKRHLQFSSPGRAHRERTGRAVPKARPLPPLTSPSTQADWCLHQA
jgi:hypothetical protein